MSRTRLAVLTALVLVALSAATFVTRRATGGVDAGAPAGASSWEVTVTVRGRFTAGKAPAVLLASPPSFRKQHIFDESWASDELTRPSGRGDAGRDPHAETAWKRRSLMPPAAGETYRLTQSFRCVLGAHRPTLGMRERTEKLDHAPAPQADGTLQATPRIESEAREIQEAAQGLVENTQTVADQVRAFNDHVLSLPYRETDGGGGALDCLRNGGDDAGRSRLLVALCRSRGINARVVTGVILNPGAPPAAHRWAEAWISAADGAGGYWLPACPTYGHFGAQGLPVNYLVVRLDDEPVARGAGDPRVTLFARTVTDKPAAGEAVSQQFWRAVSLAALTPAEQHLARFLLLLPLAAVVVSVFRVVVGITTFGVFSPALLGLIFRDLKALPWGLGIFAGTVLIGWLFRKILDRYNLLLIPRAAVMLTLIVVFLLTVVVATSRAGVHITGYIALFPLIILTHMVERFWTVEAEDGTWSSFKALAGTLTVSVAVAVALSPDAVSQWVVRYPETLGVVVAVLLLLGRYTGYRVTELYRFRDVIEFKAEAPPAAAVAEPARAGDARTAGVAGPEPAVPSPS